jgi:hypothetical protein
LLGKQKRWSHCSCGGDQWIREEKQLHILPSETLFTIRIVGYIKAIAGRNRQVLALNSFSKMATVAKITMGALCLCPSLNI